MNPYLNSKFDLLDRGGGARRGIVFGSQLHERSGRTFRRWIQLWLKQLALNASGALLQSQVFDCTVLNHFASLVRLQRSLRQKVCLVLSPYGHDVRP